MKNTTDKEKINEILTRGVEEIFVRKHLEEALLSGKKLRVKYGIDPTSPDLHLGHAVVLKKLKQFQSLGHIIVFIIGDFTASVGDPSGGIKTRPRLSSEEIKKNMKDYIQQASKIIDIKKTEVVYNSKWLGEIKGIELVRLISMVSAQQILEREDFAKRLKEHKSLRVHELLYPIMQAYDSVVLKPDIECGGTDQTFNMLLGRDLMEKFNLPPQDVLTVPILEGTDGVQKMSKSLDNYIGLTDEPNDMFGKIMSLRDELIEKYFLLCTNIPAQNIKKIIEENSNPRDQKMLLGKEIVSLYHGKEAGEKTEAVFVKTFQKKEIPEEMKEIIAPSGSLLSDIFLDKKIVSSKNEWKRLVLGGAISDLDKKTVIEDVYAKIGTQPLSLKIGKKVFIRIIPE